MPLVDVLCLVCIGEEYGAVEASMIAPLPDEAQGSLPSHADWRSLVKVWCSLDDDVSQGDLLSLRDRKPIDLSVSPVLLHPLSHV